MTSQKIPTSDVSHTPESPRRSWVEQVMGLPVSICVRGHHRDHGDHGDDREVTERVHAVYATLRLLDRQFSTYRADSEVSLHNAGTLTGASVELRQVRQLCDRARELTDGAFDADLPGGWDPSGLVKGWAVERAATALRGLDHHDWLINAGGDVLAHAHEPGSWRVGVVDPADTSRIVSVIPVTTGAVATSGTAERGPHIIDPASGRPAAPVLASATVWGPSLVWADVYATAAIVKGAVVKAEGAQAWLDALDHYRGFVVTSEVTHHQVEDRGVQGHL